jgi:hypothetical protein
MFPVVKGQRLCVLSPFGTGIRVPSRSRFGNGPAVNAAQGEDIPVTRSAISARTNPLFVLAALAAVAALPIQGQWIQALSADRPATPKVFALAAFGDQVFAGFESGVFRTSDQGRHWTGFNAGLTGDFPAVFSLATDGASLYAGRVQGGVAVLRAQSDSWAPAGLPEEYISSLAVADGRVYAGTCCHGLWISADGGATWRNAGIDTGHIASLHARAGTVFAGTLNGYFRSADSGESWVRMQIAESAAPGTTVADSALGGFAAAGRTLYAGTRRGLYRSRDAGFHWERTAFPGGWITALAADTGGLFASDGLGLFRSADEGATWRRVDSGLESTAISCLATNGGELFAGVLGFGIWRRPLSDMGSTALGDRFRGQEARRDGGQVSRAGAYRKGNLLGFAGGKKGELTNLRDARGRDMGRGRRRD